MKRFYVLVLVATAATQLVLAEPEVDKQHLQQDILEKIKSPNDTALEAEAKLLIAQFLAETTLEDLDLEQNDVVSYRRDYERERERDAQRLAERERERQRHKERQQEKERQREKHRNKPHYDYRNVSWAASQPAAAAAPVAVPVVAAVPVAAPVPVEVSRQDISTQVPILTQSPGLPSSAPGGIVPAVTAAPVAPIATLPPAPVATIPTLPPVTRPPRPTVSPEHVYNQVDKILGSVASGNIVGIVDNSLAIRAPEPVRNFVTGILKVVFCNPINRILGRCVPNSSGAISSVQGR